MTEQTTGQHDPESTTTGSTAYEESGSASTGESGATSEPGAASREWMAQLQAMIDNIATQAAPVMRDVAAKAAELAAIAGEKAGPIARRAADATAEAGAKLAERGREVAADLRRDAAAARESTDGHAVGAEEYGAAPDAPEGVVAETSGASETPGGVGDDSTRSA